jgi:alpha-1,6-mannosyltransferase
VVAARAGAFPELVDESVGMLAEPDSVTGLAEAIAALYERDIETLGATARERVLRQFTWKRAFHAQFAAYASLLGARRAPRTAGEVIELGSPSS